MDEEALVAGLRAGDTQAVEYAVQQYAPALFRYAFYQLQDTHLAEDVVSEVILRMIARIDSFVLKEVPFQAWLFSIARNLVADHYRRGVRRPEVSWDRWLSDNPAEEPGAQDPSIAGLAERDELQAALVTLTEEQRQVLLLHVVEGWDLRHVAKLLNRTLPSVRSLQYRGVQSLRRVMAGRDAQELEQEQEEEQESGEGEGQGERQLSG
jgi:RNA polymerase sigma-70 factor (ECF subfamily)